MSTSGDSASTRAIHFYFGGLHSLIWNSGSFLGTTLVNMFPDRVGRVIIDGIVDVEAYWSGTPYKVCIYSVPTYRKDINPYFVLKGLGPDA